VCVCVCALYGDMGCGRRLGRLCFVHARVCRATHTFSRGSGVSQGEMEHQTRMDNTVQSNV